MSGSLPTSTPSPLALDIARALEERWSIGVSSTFCDESEWDSASTEEIAAAIDEILLPRLSAHADKLSRAFTQDRTNMVNDAMRVMTQQDDLAEAMALGIERHLQHHVREVPELRGPLAAWREHRPEKGLV